MDLKSLLEPDGRPLKIVPYALAYAAVGCSGQFVVAIKFKDYAWGLDALGFSLISALAIIAAGHGVWRVFGKSFTTPAGIALAIIVGSFTTVMLDLYVMHEVLGYGPYPGKHYLYQLSAVRGPLLWWGLCAAAYYYLKLAEEHAAEVARAKIAWEQLRASTAEARLQALQAQVEPHFLFNTLANVKWLYRRDPESGRRMLDRLVDYLHAALPQVRQATTTLEQELRLAHAYLDIQQLRIGGRPPFSIHVPDEIARPSFPPPLLLTLVGKSIKHGIRPQT